MTRARRAASARPRPDRTRASRSDRWSVVSTSDVDGMRHHMIYNSLVQATSKSALHLTQYARSQEPGERGGALRGQAAEIDAADAPLLEGQRAAGADEVRGQLAELRLVTNE